jgi:CheY-like chemotaxis protein
MSRPKVLVVDDDRDTLHLYTTALALSGFEVVSAEDGAEALRLADREVPDAVVTDLAMPGMDGVALCRHLRAIPGARQLPVIAVSGQASPALRSDARRAGFAAVLLKPCLPDELVEIVGRLIEAPHERSRRQRDPPVGRDDRPGRDAGRRPPTSRDAPQPGTSQPSGPDSKHPAPSPRSRKSGCRACEKG